MNRIIFGATALLGLALVANVGSREPKGNGNMCSAKLALVADTGRKMPAQKKFPRQERLYAVEVTDDALEELRRINKHAYSVMQAEIFYKRR